MMQFGFLDELLDFNGICATDSIEQNVRGRVFDCRDRVICNDGNGGVDR